MVETFYFKSGAGVLLRLPAHADPGRHMTRGRGNSIFAGHSPHCRATTLQIRRPMRPWIGLCSFDADGNMVLGWDRDCDGVFWLAVQGLRHSERSRRSRAGSPPVIGLNPAESLRVQGLNAAALSPLHLR